VENPEYRIPNNETQLASKLAVDLNQYAAEIMKRYKFDAAEIALRKCIAMHPKIDAFYVNLGGVLSDANKIPEAIDVLEKCIALNPQHAKAWGNLGMAYGKIGQFELSMQFYDKALKIAPRDHGILWNRAFTKASFGHWDIIDQYEKYRTKQARGIDLFKDSPFPYWNGKDDLNGKTLYVQFDQGIGDRILYSRFVWHLKQEYPDCTILASGNERTNTLLWGFQQEGICTLLPEKIPFPKADLGIYATELAVRAKITPDNVPSDPGLILRYVQPMAKIMRKYFPMPLLPAVKIGVCWTGNPDMPKNHERSIPAELMLSLAELPHVALYSLQAGPGASDIDRLQAYELIHCGSSLGADLGDKSLSFTGATILNCDIIITCCTSIAHLAGALGVPTLLLLCSDPYWIWTRFGETTAWYPSIKIYRQDRMYEWRGVIDQVKADLSQKAVAEVQ